jgi:predicted lipoprotein
MKTHHLWLVVTIGHAALAACSSSSTGNPEPDPEPDVAPEFDRTEMLANLADVIIVPTLEEARARFVTLRDASALWRDELLAGRAGTLEQQSAQAAWRAAFSTWTQVDVMQVGPAGQSGATKGGLGLRDEIYAWPSISACSIDQALVANTFEDVGYFATKLINMRGLGAVEVVLFASTGANACPVAAGINTSGSWAALGDVEVQKRRARFAAAATSFVIDRTDALLAAWSNGHRADFVKDGGGVYGTPGAVIDEIVAAMMYVDQVTKDQKLGIPLGLHALCGSASCPASFESQYARSAREGVIGNLKGIRAVFSGSRDGAAAGIGIEDYLVSAEATDLAERLRSNIDEALTLAESAPADFITAVATDKDPLVALHTAVQSVDRDIKSEVVVALKITLPQTVGGDTD